MGFLSFQSFMLRSIITRSPWNLSGRLRLFSSSMESWRFRVIAGAMVVVRWIKFVVSCWSLLLREFFAPLVGTHTHLLVWFVCDLNASLNFFVMVAVLERT